MTNHKKLLEETHDQKKAVECTLSVKPPGATPTLIACARGCPVNERAGDTMAHEEESKKTV